MRDGDGGHGEDGDEIRDAPLEGHEGSDGQDDHANNEDEGEDHGEFELFIGVSKCHSETEGGYCGMLVRVKEWGQ